MAGSSKRPDRPMPRPADNEDHAPADFLMAWGAYTSQDDNDQRRGQPAVVLVR